MIFDQKIPKMQRSCSEKIIQHGKFRLIWMGFEVKKSKTQEIQTRSGFKSKSAFYLAFKAVPGIRPVDWIKENL